jgi:hopanoid biosynthesis associated protein HpnK
MVGAEYARDAIERAKEHPSLRVGLHLTLVEGLPVLPPQQIPDIVDAGGEFSTHLALSGFRFFFHPGIRKQLEAEIRAQFEAFRKTGFVLDHVNAHNHMHMHPTILRLILRIGKDYGLKAVRLPNEPPVRSWKAAGTHLTSRLSSWVFLNPWMKLMKILLNRAHVRYNDYLLGMTDGGRMTVDLVSRFVQNLPEGVTELCFHPATRRCAEIDRSMPRYHHEEEYLTLTSRTLRESIQRIGVQTIAFSDLCGKT